jgi:DNA-binding NtrC family response regulator
VLVVDDDDDHRAFLSEVLAEQGYVTSSVGSGEEALSAFASAPADAVVTDLRMGGVDGLAIIASLAQHATRPALIAMTAFGSLETATRALRAGAVDYLSKPFLLADLVEAIEGALARRARLLAQKRLHAEVDDVPQRRKG